jgi:hypothetical protein
MSPEQGIAIITVVAVIVLINIVAAFMILRALRTR